jgi:hypothetical protein
MSSSFLAKSACVECPDDQDVQLDGSFAPESGGEHRHVFREDVRLAAASAPSSV